MAEKRQRADTRAPIRAVRARVVEQPPAAAEQHQFPVGFDAKKIAHAGLCVFAWWLSSSSHETQKAYCDKLREMAENDDTTPASLTTDAIFQRMLAVQHAHFYEQNRARQDRDARDEVPPAIIDIWSAVGFNPERARGSLVCVLKRSDCRGMFTGTGLRRFVNGKTRKNMRQYVFNHAQRAPGFEARRWPLRRDARIDDLFDIAYAHGISMAGQLRWAPVRAGMCRYCREYKA